MGLLAKWEATVGMSLPRDGAGDQLAAHSKELDRANAIYAKESVGDQLKGKIPLHGKNKEKENQAAGQHQRLKGEEEVEVEAGEGGTDGLGGQVEDEYEQRGVAGAGRYRQRVGGRLNAQDDYEAELMEAQRRA